MYVFFKFRTKNLLLQTWKNQILHKMWCIISKDVEIQIFSFYSVDISVKIKQHSHYRLYSLLAQFWRPDFLLLPKGLCPAQDNSGMQIQKHCSALQRTDQKITEPTSIFFSTFWCSVPQPRRRHVLSMKSSWEVWQGQGHSWEVLTNSLQSMVCLIMSVPPSLVWQQFLWIQNQI